VTQTIANARWALMTTALSVLCLAYTYRRAVLARGVQPVLDAGADEELMRALNDALSLFETRRSRLEDLDYALLDLAASPEFRRVAMLTVADFEIKQAQARLPLEG
jgi:hypothetical protein